MEYIQNKLVRFHPFLEFTIVIAVSIGYFVYSALQWVSVTSSHPISVNYTNNDVYFLIFYELSVLVIISLFLKLQGWNFKDFGLSVKIERITAGLVLFVVSYFSYLLLFKLFGDFFVNNTTDSSGYNVSFRVQLNMMPLFLFTAVNPFFEEFILVGYVVNAVRSKMGLIVTIAISCFLRLSFHIYQGPIIILNILPMGILFVAYFWYKKSIVPLILGHALMDFLSLYTYMVLMQNH